MWQHYKKLYDIKKENVICEITHRKRMCEFYLDQPLYIFTLKFERFSIVCTEKKKKCLN